MSQTTLSRTSRNTRATIVLGEDGRPLYVHMPMSQRLQGSSKFMGALWLTAACVLGADTAMFLPQMHP